MKQFSIKETIANPLEDSLLKNLESAADEKDDLSVDEIAALPEIKFRRAEYSGTNAEKPAIPIIPIGAARSACSAKIALRYRCWR